MDRIAPSMSLADQIVGFGAGQAVQQDIDHVEDAGVHQYGFWFAVGADDRRLALFGGGDEPGELCAGGSDGEDIAVSHTRKCT